MQQFNQPVKGIYQLLIQLSFEKRIIIGAIGERFFRAGHYIYTGSAQKGLKSRIERHLREPEQKKFHWHIDYLLQFAKITQVVIFPERTRSEECSINRFLLSSLGEEAQCIEAFGASDCACKGHLLYLKNPEALVSYFSIIRENYRYMKFHENALSASRVRGSVLLDKEKR